MTFQDCEEYLINGERVLARHLYDKNGHPISINKFYKLSNSEEYRRVAYDEVGIYAISTVWEGIDYNKGYGDLAIYETMVFVNDGLFSDLECIHSATEQDARAVHQRMVKKYSRFPQD